MKVTAHLDCLKNQFPFKLRDPLCFIDPYLSSGQYLSLVNGQSNCVRDKKEGDKKKTKKAIKKVHLSTCNRYKVGCIQDIYSQCGLAWLFPMKYLRTVGIFMRMCVLDCWICDLLWRLLCRLIPSFKTPFFFFLGQTQQLLSPVSVCSLIPPLPHHTITPPPSLHSTKFLSSC